MNLFVLYTVVLYIFYSQLYEHTINTATLCNCLHCSQIVYKLFTEYLFTNFQKYVII